MPYTEKRRHRLTEINESIAAYVENVKDWDDVPADVRADFWRSKASVLWSGDIPDDLYASDEFEHELLMDSERFFLRRQASHLKKLSHILALPIIMLAKLLQVARNAFGSTASELTNIKATYSQPSIQLLPCRYGISLPISSQRRL